jgi:putative transposase
MREHALLQRRRSEGRRRRPGFFRVECPDQLWHLDMTSVWVAEHGWCYLNAVIDCCTREITGWGLDIRCRAAEAITVIEQAVAERGIRPGELTLGSDNGTAFTSRAFRARLAELGIVHRRGGYRPREAPEHRVRLRAASLGDVAQEPAAHVPRDRQRWVNLRVSAHEPAPSKRATSSFAAAWVSLSPPRMARPR